MFTTACFHECRTKQNPPAKRNETHLPKETKPTCLRCLGARFAHVTALSG